MPQSIEFVIPKEMEPKTVADIMSAYLLGDRAFENGTILNPTGPSYRRYGPFWNEESQKWQLDTTNDYWFRINADKGLLTCRYDNVAVLAAMKVLFDLRYSNPFPE